MRERLEINRPMGSGESPFESYVAIGVTIMVNTTIGFRVWIIYERTFITLIGNQTAIDEPKF